MILTESRMRAMGKVKQPEYIVSYEYITYAIELGCKKIHSVAINLATQNRVHNYSRVQFTASDFEYYIALNFC